jgi:hypothetical protein
MTDLRIPNVAGAILALLLHATSGLAQEAFSVNGNSREQVRQFYNAVYTASDGVPIDSTANITNNCFAGTNSPAFQNAVLWRINWFRAMSGIPAGVTFSATESAADQSAALMMSANNQVLHTDIPPSWSCFDPSGTNAADNSNLSLGVNGPDAITDYIWDYGAINYQVNHRRWLLYPQTQVMASGDVPAQGAYAAANATWIYDTNFGGPRPATTYPYVAWPPPGYVPYPVVFPQWSFALSNADLSSATVTMLSNGVPLSVTIQTNVTGYGEDTLVWYPSAIDPTSYSTVFPFNGADTVYSITISNVPIGVASNLQSFSYYVTNFDPALPGADYVPTIISGTNRPSVNENNPYACTPSANPNITGYQWLVAQSTNGNLSDQATNGLVNFTISPPPLYAVITNPPVGSGKCFHLTHTNPVPQLLQFTEILFPATNTALSFQSFLGYATTNEVARVQISTNGGGAWMDLYTQTGTDGSGRAAFVAHTLSLSNCAGQITYVRFNYDYVGGDYYSQTAADSGWCIENIVMTNTGQLVGFTTNATVSTNFNFAPSQTGNWILEASGVIFNQFGLDWSPASQLAAISPPNITTQPTNQSLSSGGTVAFSVGVSGPGSFTYQWQFDGANLWGATLSTLTLENIQASEAGTYDVIVSDPSGVVTSSNAVLTVLPPPPPVESTMHPRITTQPKSQTIPIESTVFLSVSAVGGAPLSYQWKRNGVNLSDESNYTGSASATLVIAGAQAANAGSYTVTVSDTNGAANSAAAVLDVGAPITVQINGAGVVIPNYNGRILSLGRGYAMTALPKSGAKFAGWSGDINTNTATVRFTVESNLILEANFVPNPFLAAGGIYHGLFAPTNAARTQTNSGAFNLNVTGAGALSGNLLIGSDNVRLSGIFDLSGNTRITSTQPGKNTLTTSLQLDFANPFVTGTVTDGSFTAQLFGGQAVFNSTEKTANYEGQYTLVIPGVDNSTVGPFGTSYGTVTVDAMGNVTFAGSLADGTSISQAGVVSADGVWPLYVPLYSGNGSIWSWNRFINGAITFATNASWINTTNPAKTGLYRAGFTNEALSVISSAYDPTNKPLLALTDGQVVLDGGNVPTITNQITLASNNTITLTAAAENTNKLTLTINNSTGVIHGTFANPSDPRQTVNINGVLLQNETNATGYFMGSNQSGTFLLNPQ